MFGGVSIIVTAPKCYINFEYTNQLMANASIILNEITVYFAIKASKRA